MAASSSIPKDTMTGADNTEALSSQPMKQLFSREEECTLRSALAFVLMRRRNMQARNPKNGGKTEPPNLPPPERDEQRKSEKRDQRQDASRKRHSDGAPMFLDGLLNTDAQSKKRGKGTNPLGGYIDTTHISTMIRVAISEALTLYESHELFHPIEKEAPEIRPIVYDYHAASCHHAMPSRYAILDGIAKHIASHLRQSRRLDDDRQPNKKDTSTAFGILYATLLSIVRPESGERRIRKEGREEHQIRCALAVCTVLHRIMYFDNSNSSEAMRATCFILSDLYYDKFHKDGVTRSPFPDSQKSHLSNDNEIATEMVDHNNFLELPCFADILAVNLLYLLEGIIALRLRSVASSNLSPIAAFIWRDMKDSLGPEIICPVPIQDMAYVYNKESQKKYGRNACVLEPGSKLLLRMGIYDLSNKLSAYHLS
eukprot:scaffold167058_cov39-Attheya_sp.AAC.1